MNKQLKKIFLQYFDVFRYRTRMNIKRNPHRFLPKKEIFDNSPVTIGIIKEAWHLHYHYITACRDLKISYVLIDIFKSDWLEQILHSNVDVLFFRPSVQYSPWKDMFDNRIRLLSNDNRFKLFPNPESLWIWENKLRTMDWLRINHLKAPKTWIFYDESEAKQFANETNFPIVYKMSAGSGSSGVKILNRKHELLKQINICFNKGEKTYRSHRLDKEFGFIILQEFFEDVKEWRIIRMGNYYFGYEKIRVDKFHSGSGEFGYGMPPEPLLDYVKKITENFGFLYVDIDIFITPDFEFYVNEIQPYFGQKDDRELLRINGVSGRLSYDNSIWVFEPGEYCKNNFSNLRITEFLKSVN